MGAITSAATTASTLSGVGDIAVASTDQDILAAAQTAAKIKKDVNDGNKDLF